MGRKSNLFVDFGVKLSVKMYLLTLHILFYSILVVTRGIRHLFINVENQRLSLLSLFILLLWLVAVYIYYS